MSRPKLLVWALLALLVAGAPTGARADTVAAPDSGRADASPVHQSAHWFGDSRGVVVGIGGGYGSGRVLYPDLVDGARFSRDWRRGNSLDLTLDLPFAARATAGVGLTAWFGGIWTSRTVLGEPSAKDDNWSLTTVSARFIWYPLGGLFLRGSIGRAAVAVTFSDFYGFEQIMRDAGLGWSVGAGYEIGVARGLALVPALEWRGFELGSGNRAEAMVVVLSAALAP